MKNRLRGLIKQIVKAISNPTGEETLAEGIADNQAYMELVTGHLARAVLELGGVGEPNN